MSIYYWNPNPINMQKSYPKAKLCVPQEKKKLENLCRFVFRGHRGRDRMVVWFTTTCAISAYHQCTKIVSSNPVHGKVYSIQHYVIKFVSDLLKVGVFFLSVTPVSYTNKTDHRDVTNIVESGVKHHKLNLKPNILSSSCCNVNSVCICVCRVCSMCIVDKLTLTCHYTQQLNIIVVNDHLIFLRSTRIL